MRDFSIWLCIICLGVASLIDHIVPPQPCYCPDDGCCKCEDIRPVDPVVPASEPVFDAKKDWTIPDLIAAPERTYLVHESIEFNVDQKTIKILDEGEGKIFQWDACLMGTDLCLFNCGNEVIALSFQNLRVFINGKYLTQEEYFGSQE